MKNYDRMEIYVRKNEKAKITRKAHRNGLSVSKFVVISCLGKAEENECIARNITQISNAD